MESLTEDFYLKLIAGSFIVLFILWVGWRLRIAWKNFLFSLVRRRGRIGEDIAINLLKKNGYEIVQSQLPLTGSCIVDGKPMDFNVRVDYLVERNGLKYLAEVKTGDAADPKNIGTRRQLFEYAALSRSEQVLLVDATSKKVMLIGFNHKQKID